MRLHGISAMMQTIAAYLYAAFLLLLGVLFAPPIGGMNTGWPWSDPLRGMSIVKYHGGCGYGGWRCGTWSSDGRCADHEHAPAWCGYVVPDLQSGECVAFDGLELASNAAVFYRGYGWGHPLMVEEVTDPDDCSVTRRVNGNVVGG